MIELPTLGGAGDRLWNGLIDIAERMPDDWTLIGGQMVLLHGLEAGRTAPRISEDLDMVVNARVRPPALRRMVETLRALDFDATGVSPDGVAHRFDRAGVLVDISAPDGLGPGTDLTTIANAVTIQTSGGTYALNESALVEVSFDGRTCLVPRPSLAGALVSKAGAATSDRGSKGAGRHLSDLAFLSSLADDAFALAAHLGSGNRRRLRAVTDLADPGHEAWVLLGQDRDDAFAAWRWLAGLA
jgi:hypothetical protein